MDRDRDQDGRPRNARPRDGLGRPLPYGVEGVPRQPEGVVRTPQQTLHDAQRLLDAGRPFHAHEVFEDAWKSTRDNGSAESGLWQALAQWAVGLTHRMRGRPVGAARLLDRAAAGLDPYRADPPYGIDVGALADWARTPDIGAPPRLQTADGPTP
ncbi:DUF309 domain-containing protein [Williamsia sterculiae]|uniref:DUF309 domain-containing protein n=1 Tax=Williamsia sterculiae TaxID=1344003 RepID=A0A1N7CBP8_9NOCA|nr:DUF309 domain-containing protein [Williamsia sterculiae]SIR60992.1 hypothetical protein SAMN05445060_0023 [Williamsia sterculiae]